MKIITASPGHLEPLAQLFDAYRVFYRKETDLDGARKFLSERLSRRDSEIYLAFEAASDTYCGFIQLYPLFSSTRMQRLWLLNDLYVQASFRGLGISKALIQRAKDLAQATQAAGLMLETEKSNVIGNQLYPATGFDLIDNNFYFWTNTNAS